MKENIFKNNKLFAQHYSSLNRKGMFTKLNVFFDYLIFAYRSEDRDNTVKTIIELLQEMF